MDDPALHYLPLTEVADRLRRRILSPVELVEDTLARIARHDGHLSSFITTLPGRAMDRARQAETEIGSGNYRGPLHGVPIAVKDLVATAFAPTTAGMAVGGDLVPRRNATVVERLEEGGAIIVGKLAMTEGAFVGHHPNLPSPRNPWSAEHWTGASSSGSGAATAAGLCYAALGSDTGASIRLPSSLCGLTGIKPTWGRVSRDGVFPLAQTLDHVGPMARNVADAAVVLGRISGRDRCDPTTLDAPVPVYLVELGQGVRGIRLGVDERFISSDTDPEVVAIVTAAIVALQRCGMALRDVSIPSPLGLVERWLTVCAAEAAVAHRHTYPAQAERYGPELAALLDRSRAASGDAVAQAYIERSVYAGQLAEVFAEVDMLILPVSANRTPRNDAVAARAMARSDQAFATGIRYTAPFNMTGHPALALQGGFDSAGLPIGFQLVAPHLEESLLLRAGHAFQQVTDWHACHPELLATT